MEVKFEYETVLVSDIPHGKKFLLGADTWIRVKCEFNKNLSDTFVYAMNLSLMNGEIHKIEPNTEARFPAKPLDQMYFGMLDAGTWFVPLGTQHLYVKVYSENESKALDAKTGILSTFPDDLTVTVPDVSVKVIV
jgi:hypothetical protein